ncbi:hypothetical protein H109_07330 [Trichophyton interdigitale MR816]|uniref:Uncharacterized protein n=1 Tax=Trichophyton interdigitale (strain MR816) TaxID=1215338 RepID=A0A059IYZ8_TRIIM|nr:hypothetical protein H101_03652 [Trichophyton interdigitale H6]KDB20719.1 hypothetical protein H109_07330 [Trichophyton interdigitale MR816]
MADFAEALCKFTNYRTQETLDSMYLESLQNFRDESQMLAWHPGANSVRISFSFASSLESATIAQRSYAKLPQTTLWRQAMMDQYRAGDMRCSATQMLDGKIRGDILALRKRSDIALQCHHPG